MLRIRVPIAIAMLAGLFGILYADFGSRWKVGCHLLFMVISVLAILEFYKLISATGQYKPVRHIGVFACIALTLGEWATYQKDLWGQSITFWSINGIIIGLTIFLLLAYHARPEAFKDAPGNIMATLFGIMYIWFLGSYLTRIAMLENKHFASEDVGIKCLLLTVVVAKFADVGAYLIGRMIGRTKLSPNISPNKTVEGALAGLLTSIAMAALLQTQLQIPFLNWTEVTIFGLVIGFTGELGDLAESLLKRMCDAKDSASLLPGFGGVLDVIDSLLAAAPVSYVLLLLFSRV